MLCNGENMLCNGENMLCNGENMFCNGENMFCNGENMLCNKLSVISVGQKKLHASLGFSFLDSLYSLIIMAKQ